MERVEPQMHELIKKIGDLWRNSKNNPKTSKEIVEAWNKLVEDWANDTSMPLIVRRSSDPRGHEFTHTTGRKIIISDNSAATWIMHQVLAGKTVTLFDIKQLLKKNELPIAFAFKAGEKADAKYTKTLGSFGLPDWTVCHIEPVGLKKKTDITEIDINLLVNHFKKYLSPGNMFVLPKCIAGLGDISDFIDEQK